MRGRIIFQAEGDHVGVAEPFKEIVTDALAGRDAGPEIAEIEVPESGTGGHTIRKCPITVRRVVGDLGDRGQKVEQLQQLGVVVGGSGTGGQGTRGFSEQVTLIGNADADEVEAAVDASMREADEPVAFLVTGDAAGDVVRSVTRNMPADVTVIQVDV